MPSMAVSLAGVCVAGLGEHQFHQNRGTKPCTSIHALDEPLRIVRDAGGHCRGGGGDERWLVNGRAAVSACFGRARQRRRAALHPLQLAFQCCVGAIRLAPGNRLIRSVRWYRAACSYVTLGLFVETHPGWPGGRGHTCSRTRGVDLTPRLQPPRRAVRGFPPPPPPPFFPPPPPPPPPPPRGGGAPPPPPPWNCASCPSTTAGSKHAIERLERAGLHFDHRPNRRALKTDRRAFKFAQRTRRPGDDESGRRRPPAEGWRPATSPPCAGGVM